MAEVFSLGISGASDAYRRETRRRVASRVPVGVAFLLANAAVATAFELVRFPDRRPWMLAADAFFLAIGGLLVGVTRLRPDAAVPAALVAVNLLGLELNGYHALVGAQVGMVIWTLTALLASVVVLLPWGARAQAAASIGALAGYPMMLPGAQTEALVWAAGGVYLLVVVTMSVVGAGLIDRYLAADFSLTQALSEREARLEDLLAREQEARLAAETASRIKDEFLATVSHELRTPLTPILGWVHQLRDGGLSGAEQDVALEAIDRASGALVQLIDDLLDVSRITSGKLRLRTRPVEVAGVVTAAIASMRPAAEAKGIALVTEFPEAQAIVAGDPDRLQQVVWNLVSNAIKFTDPGGQVRITLGRRHGGAIELVVRDTGRGIAPELLPHVFERFWQADGSSTRTAGGLGLGLAIVRHLVELHGGSVAAESAGPGRGASFRVQLPPGAGSEREAPAPAGSAPWSLAGLTALVVDDESDGKEMVRALLERRGIRVRTASSANQALDLLDEASFDVLISDLAMPQQDGIALIRALRAREASRGGHVPAIAFTARAALEDRSRALAAGFDDYLAKPSDPEALLARVASLAAAARS